MESFPASAYQRLLENRRRKGERSKIDLPLLFFVFFLRLGAGAGMVAGSFLLARSGGAPIRLLILFALAFLVAAVLAAITHLTVRSGFVRMVRNLRSPLTHEILLTGVYISICGAALLMAFLGAPLGTVPVLLAGGGLLLIAPLALLGAGRAYRYKSRPAWDSIYIPIYYALSGPLLGLAVYFLLERGAPFSARPGGTKLLLLMFLLIGGEVLIGRLYLGYLDSGYRDTVAELTRGRYRLLFNAFLVFSFLLPAFFILFSAAGVVDGTIPLASSLVVGLFLERVLFFKLERPVYFFYHIGSRDKGLAKSSAG